MPASWERALEVGRTNHLRSLGGVGGLLLLLQVRGGGGVGKEQSMTRAEGGGTI